MTTDRTRGTRVGYSLTIFTAINHMPISAMCFRIANKRMLVVDR